MVFMTTEKSDLLIIGAGLSGLVAATTLADHDTRITLIDKGRSVGGRLATRRIGPGRADHGAQFFTVRDERFRNHVDRWIANGLVFHWSNGWSNGSVDDAPPDGYPRYAVKRGMNALAKQIAAELTAHRGVKMHVNTVVVAVSVDGDGWRVTTADGRVFPAHVLTMTAPVPQSLALLDAGGTALQTADLTSLEQIQYAPCLCGLAWVDGEVSLPTPGAVQQPNAPISWIADNRTKGVSPEASIITVHAGPELSRMLYDEPDEALHSLFAEALEPYLASPAAIRQLDLKRWRYALPTVLYPDRYLRASSLPPLFFAGDAFGGPRVEGAALSGIAAGDAIRELNDEP